MAAGEATFVWVHAPASPLQELEVQVFVVLGLGGNYKDGFLVLIVDVKDCHLGSVGVGWPPGPHFQFYSFAVFLEDEVENIVLDGIPDFLELRILDFVLVFDALILIFIHDIVDASFKHSADLMGNHEYKLLEVVLVGVGVGWIVEGFDIYFPFLNEIPLVVTVHVLVAWILEGQPYKTLGFYLRETHFRCFLLEFCQQLSYLHCWLDFSVELLKVFAVLSWRCALNQIVEIFEIIRVLYYFCYSLQLTYWVVEMFALEYISLLHLNQSFIEKGVIWCDYHIWGFTEDVEKLFCYFGCILGRVMG